MTCRFTPIPQQELFDEILTPIYQAKCVQFGLPKRDFFINTLLRSFELRQCHALALLLIVFALGALFDAKRQPQSTEAQQYDHLARTLLAFNPQATCLSITASVSLYTLVDDPVSDLS
jgi:hypothetical protein